MQKLRPSILEESFKREGLKIQPLHFAVLVSLSRSMSRFLIFRNQARRSRLSILGGPFLALLTSMDTRALTRAPSKEMFTSINTGKPGRLLPLLVEAGLALHNPDCRQFFVALLNLLDLLSSRQLVLCLPKHSTSTSGSSGGSWERHAEVVHALQDSVYLVLKPLLQKSFFHLQLVSSRDARVFPPKSWTSSTRPRMPSRAYVTVELGLCSFQGLLKSSSS